MATYQLKELRSVHLQMAVKGGSLGETDENNGVAHFMEHMLVQGTPSFPNVEEFSSYIERLAGSYGAYTDSLNVGFTLTVPALHLADAIKIGSEVFFEPLFESTALEKERRVVADEITQRMDSHWFKINKFFRQTRFGPKHPLTINPGGSIEVVKKVTREELLDYWKKYFVPRNTYLLISGNFDDATLRQLLEDHFEKYTSKAEFPGYPKLSNKDFSKKQVAIRHDTTLSSSYVDFAFPSINIFAPLELRMRENIALIILGELRNSRLFKLLRYQKGLVYHVSAGASLWPGLGYVYITSEVGPDHTEEVVQLIWQELQTYITNGPTEEELTMVKHYLINQWMMAFDHPSAITGWIENDLLWNDKIRLPEEYGQIIEKITCQDIIALMQEHWDLSRLNVTIQGPLKNPSVVL